MRFLRVTHSIPDGMAVVVDTPFGSILHTGDFKIDQTPLDGRPTDLHGLAEEAERRACTCCSRDSTNAEEAGLHRRASAASVRCCTRHRRAGAAGIVVVGVLLEPHPSRSSRS